jgi:hypothetical protein
MSRPPQWVFDGFDRCWHDISYDDFARRYIPEDDDPPASKPAMAARHVSWDISPEHEGTMSAAPQPDNVLDELQTAFRTERDDVRIQFLPRRELRGTCPLCLKPYGPDDLSEHEMPSGELWHRHTCGWDIENEAEAAAVRALLFTGEDPKRG